MKNFIYTIVLFLSYGVVIHAQEIKPNFYKIKEAREKKFSELKKSVSTDLKEIEDSEYTNYQRWLHHWKYRIGPDGDMTRGTEEMVKYLEQQKSVPCGPSSENSHSWINLGPFNSENTIKHNQGRIECISVNPQDHDEILVGAWNGGIWKTEDGGATWSNQTDDEGYSQFGFSSIVRLPSNPDIVYASSSLGNGSWEGSRKMYGMGVIVSFDGGENWTTTGLNYPNYQWNSFIEKMVIDPASTSSNVILYAKGRSKIYKWEGATNASGTWDEICNEPDNRIFDIEVDTTGTLYISDKLGLRKYTGICNPINNVPIPSAINPSDILEIHTNIEINKQNHLVLLSSYVLDGLPNQTYLMKRTATNGSFTTPKNVTSNAYFYSSAKYAQLAVSPYNSDVVYMEKNRWNRQVYKSVNFGDSFVKTGTTINHDDIRNFLVLEGNPNGDSSFDNIYLCTDGGVSNTTNGFDWVDITGQGMSITNYYGFGLNQKNEKQIFCGAQDGSINYYNNGNWYETAPGGDNGDCLVYDDGTTLNAITEIQNTVVAGVLTNNSYSWSKFTNFSGSWMNPLIQNPYNKDEYLIGVNAIHLRSFDDKNFSDQLVHPDSEVASKKISSVAISQANDDIIYYSTDSHFWDLDTLHFAKEGIYKIDRSGTVPQFENITNNLKTKCNNNGICGLPNTITDIAVDPYDEDKIWISMGDFESNSKVHFSNNGGQTWQNITKTGLPNFPATAIAYQSMTNGRIYVGTDVGVFYTDNSKKCWEKYGSNSMQVMITDMELNECAGKLVVTTNGRGLWEIPLIQDNYTVEINNNQTWDYDRSITSNLKVKSGATLTINNSTINISEGVKIEVEKGARLNLNSSTLTNECGHIWEGIEVYGDASLPQTFNNQGAVIAHNSTIEHAVTALNLWHYGNLSETGGIIQAFNTSFTNNKRSAQFMQYDNFDNISEFVLCEFKTDEHYRHDASLLSHISMWAVKGVDILGCRFVNTAMFSYHDNRVRGISAADANFTVDAYCPNGGNPADCSNIVPSTFLGFNAAIKVSNSGSNFNYNVYRSDFINNVFGIHTTSYNNFNIRDNSFFVGKDDVSPYVDVHEGITIMSGSGFTIDENVFEPTFDSFNAPITIGIRASGTGTSNNTIYNNHFRKSDTTNDNVFYANLANEINKNVFGNNSIGLKYECNTNTNNILKGNDFSVTDEGIADQQGTFSNPAGNTFSLGNDVQGSDFNNAGSTSIAYFHSSVTNQTPINTYGIGTFVSNKDNSCIDKFELQSGGGEIKNEERYKTVANENSRNKQLLKRKIDNGDTPATLKQIADASSKNSDRVIDNLIKTSPYNSHEVLSHVVSKAGIFNRFKLIELLKLNPDVLRNDMTLLENNYLVSNLGQREITEIENTYKNVTDRTSLELSINENNNTLDEIIKSSIDLVLDNETINPSLLGKWIARKASIEGRMEYIDFQLNYDKTENALATMNALASEFTNPKLDQEITSFIDLKKLQIGFSKTGKSIFALDDSDIGSIQKIADASKGLAGNQARAILDLNMVNNYVRPKFPSNKREVTKKIEPSGTLQNESIATTQLTASPNPSSSVVTFSLINENPGHLTLKVINSLGFEIVSKRISEGTSKVLFNFDSLTPGIYLYYLIDDTGKKLQTQKLIIN